MDDSSLLQSLTGGMQTTKAKSDKEDEASEDKANPETEEKGCKKERSFPSCSRPDGNNELDICDLAGNVAEWVWDGFDTYDLKTQKDPLGPNVTDSRVIRGGSWNSTEHHLQSKRRAMKQPKTVSPEIGFRLVRTIIRISVD